MQFQSLIQDLGKENEIRNQMNTRNEVKDPPEFGTSP